MGTASLMAATAARMAPWSSGAMPRPEVTREKREAPRRGRWRRPPTRLGGAGDSGAPGWALADWEQKAQSSEHRPDLALMMTQKLTRRPKCRSRSRAASPSRGHNAAADRQTALPNPNNSSPEKYRPGRTDCQP